MQVIVYESAPAPSPVKPNKSKNSFLDRHRLRRQTHALLAAAVLAGCAWPPPGTEPPEPTLAEQVAAVRQEKTDRIHLEHSPLVDDDLRAIAGLSGLRELLIDDTRSRITAAGIKHLASLPKLEHLRIRGGGIDDGAAEELAKLEGLRILNVPRADFTDQGLARLARLPALEMLRFGSPRATNSAVAALAQMPALKRLHLIDVPITDEGLRALAQIERLESLYIDGAELSDAAVDELFRARPRLHVHFNQEHHDRDPNKHQHR